MKFVFSALEVKEIILSAVVLSVAFAIAFSGGVAGVNFSRLPTLALFSFIAVGIGFLAHELIGHKFFAQKFSLHAEYRMWRFGLIFALVSSFAGFVFAAPGAVYIQQKLDMWGNPRPVSAKNMGITSVMGPVVNVAIAGVFLLTGVFYPHELLTFGASINIWLALFNMIPIPPLDGSKVFAWDRRIFAAVFIPILALFVYL